MNSRFSTVRKISLAITFAVPVFSMSTASHAGTEDQKRLCLNDILKFCSSDIPDEAKVNACMTRHAAELSPKCLAVAPRK